jgi:hypothetical protein
MSYYPDESGRVAAGLKEKDSDLLSQTPVIEKMDILAAKNCHNR